MKFLLPALLLLSLASGCSLEYQEMAETLGEETPELRMESVSVVSVEEDRERFRIDADVLAEFSADYRREISGARFAEYAEDGTVSAEGEADRISFDTRTDDAVLEGSIRFRSVSDKTTVEADFLEWVDSQRRLRGSPTGEVALLREDGTRIRGAGFEADFPTRTFSFSAGVSGVYIIGTE